MWERIKVHPDCRKLNKALYGLKQASLSWNKRFTNFLKSKNVIQLKSEPCLFMKEDRKLFLGIYVDDGILVGENIEEMNNLLKELKKEFQAYSNPDAETS
jgi:hypothetical protein